jgi:divalent metal cation (Fe/Co/Zn/Cd) transporter
VFEIVSLAFSMKAVEKTRTALARKHYPKLSWFKAIHISKDPGVFEVYAEGGASIAGLAIAAAGIIGAWLGWAQADGIASISIGLLLAIVAFVLGVETRSLLTGESAARPVVAEMRSILEADNRVEQVSDVQSMHLGPEQILVAVTADFQDSLTGPELETAVDQLTNRLKAADPRITRLYLRPGKARETIEGEG